MSASLTRRSFLKSTSSTGVALLVPFFLPDKNLFAESTTPDSTLFAPNAWLEISTNGSVKIWCGKSEIGQGVRTSLPMIVAEELSCDWRKVEVMQADLDPRYGNQLTGGSLSVRTSYENLRKAGEEWRARGPGAPRGGRNAPFCSSKGLER